MNEDFLHYIWKFQQFNPNDLQTTTGEKLEILKPGLHNFNSGPDFFNGQIRLDQTRWAGNIEIHTQSSDWKLHNHQEDEIYDKVILHVVWENNQPVYRQNGDEIPCLELKGLVKKRLLDKYHDLKENNYWIPCEEQLLNIDDAIKRQVIDQKLVERLKEKLDRILQVHSSLKGDWEATLFQLLTKYFGFKVNAIPFEILATSIPYHLIRKHQSNNKQLAALLFGQAGLLKSECSDAYPKELKNEYEFLKRKFDLHPIDTSMWKFMRMRPANFPTIRLAQLLACLQDHKSLFQSIIEVKSLKALKRLFAVEANSYWKNHFQFDKLSASNSAKKLGESSIEILLINAVIPILFTYGKQLGQESIQEKALNFMQELKPEKNKITKKWMDFEMPMESAYDSQALIQLKTKHCDFKKCLFCTIGNTILKAN